MTAFEAVTAVIAVFFGFGIVMGALIVVTLPVWRRHREERRRMRNSRRRHTDNGDWWNQSRRDDDARPPRWPAG